MTNIPSDWKIKYLRKCIRRMPEYGANSPSVDFSNNLPRYIRITDIRDNGKLIQNGKVSISLEGNEKYILKDGDFLFARSGATVGKTYLYDTRDGCAIFAGYLIRFQPNTKILSPEFLKYYTQSHRYWYWVKTTLRAGAQPNINAQEYGSLSIPLPPILEQQKIAEILSTWDEAIEKTERLIAALQTRKKGLMQCLLTGQVRFPEFNNSTKYRKTKYGTFPEDWKIDNTKNLFYIKGRIGWRGLKKSEFINSGPYLITGVDFNDKGGIKWNQCFHISHERYIESPEIIVKEKDILITKDGTIGKVVYVSSLPGEASLNSHLLLVRLKNKDIEPLFSFYIFQSDIFKTYIIRNKSGSTLTGLPQGVFEKFPIHYPSIEEQQKIVDVLQLCDKDINLNKQKLENLQIQKKGLMQRLLTGQVRVKLE